MKNYNQTSDKSEERRLLKKLLNGETEAGSRSALARILEEYPYFSLGHGLMVKYFGATLDEESLEANKASAALGCADRQAMMSVAGPENFDTRFFYPPENPQGKKITTEKAIDIYNKFFSQTGEDSETAVLEKLIFNPPVDYMEKLERDEEKKQLHTEEESTPRDETMERINNFLHDRPAPKSGNCKNPDSKTDNIENPLDEAPADTKTNGVSSDSPIYSKSDLLSESLAKFYIKRGRYKQAYEIISSLSLKFPKKSVYFADQLRFLQKLILIEEIKAGKCSK